MGSKQFFLLADYSKFGLIGAVYLGGLNEVDCIVTDSKADKQKLKVFEQYETKVVVAD
jgi:DeoR/GlpR family transcriptional regulator of sugar metabolism